MGQVRFLILLILLFTFAFDLTFLEALEQKASRPLEVDFERGSSKGVSAVIGENPVLSRQVHELGYEFLDQTRTDDPFEYNREPVQKKKPYTGDFLAATMLGTSGLMEVPSPGTLKKGQFQIGANYMDRRIGEGDQRLTARLMFHSLTFGATNILELGFGASGYYKANTNTAFYNGKLRLTDPRRSRLQAALGINYFDFGSTTTNNFTDTWITTSLPLNHASQIIVTTHKVSTYEDITFSGGLLTDLTQVSSNPVALMIEASQDQNNNFTRYNYGLRIPFTDNAIIDLMLVKDINRNEFSPAIGATFRF